MLKKYLVVPLRQALAAVIPAALIVGRIDPEKLDAAIVALIFAFVIAIAIWEYFYSIATDKKAECLKFFDEMTMAIITGFVTAVFVGLFVDDPELVINSCLSGLAASILVLPILRWCLKKWLDKSLSEQSK